MCRHNLEMCQACGKDTRSTNHALRDCREESVTTRRKIWYNGVSKQIYKMKDRDLRGIAEDMWTKMKCRRGGEMAMVGCFQPRWVDLMIKGDMPLRDGEDRIMMNILKCIGAGARDMVKVYADATGGGELAKNLRQTNILGYFGRKGKGIDTNRNLITYKNEIVRDSKKKRKGKKLEENKIIRKGGFEMVPEIDGIIYLKFKER